MGIDAWHLLQDVTIGVVTALPLEYSAVCHVLEFSQNVSVQQRSYKIGHVRNVVTGDPQKIAVTRLLDMGTNSAAAATTSLIADCPNIYCVIMCGIAGAMPSPEKPSDHRRLGDVLTLDQRGVVQYDHESVREHSVETRPRYYPPSAPLLDVSRELAGLEVLGQRPWFDHLESALSRFGEPSGALRKRWSRPPDSEDELRELSSKRWLDQPYRFLRWAGFTVEYRIIPHPYDNLRAECPLRVFQGPIASANRLQRNSRQRDLLAHKFATIGLDMESAGVAEAAHKSSVGYFVVRGASDYCNESKNNMWQPYAALSAAAYLRALLERSPPPPLSSSPSSTISGGGSKIVGLGLVNTGPGTAFKPPFDEPSANTVVADLGGAVMDALSQNARDTIAQLETLIETLELPRAIERSAEFYPWLERNEEHLSQALRSDSYSILARVEIVRAQTAKATGKPFDVTLAQELLEKARRHG